MLTILFVSVHFINLCNVVVPPRSGMALGLSLLAFVTLKVEQLLSGSSTETDDEKNRSALKDRKAELQQWLEASMSFKLDIATGVITTHSLVDEEDEAGGGTLD
jgi:hypothetical protein